MFISFIATFVILLILMSYMATSSIGSDGASARLAFEKTAFVYPKEEVIVTAVEHFCQADTASCKAFQSGNAISLQLTDISAYLPANFSAQNGLGGSFSTISIRDTGNAGLFTTIRITQDIPDDKVRKIYLNHYRGKKYGVSPDCQVGFATSTPPCGSNNVYHDFSSSLELRLALQ